MKIIVKILGVIAALVLIISAIGLIFFSSHIHVDRSVVINQDRASTFNFLNDLKNQAAWSPWQEKDPKAKYEFTSNTVGEGAEMKWTSEVKDVGNGSMTISTATPDSVIRMDLNFMENGVAKSSYVVVPDSNGTKVIWSLDVEAGANPLLRIMGKFMDGMVGKDFEKGLSKLKTVLESGVTSSSQKIEEVQVPEINYMALRGKVEVEAISNFLGQSYQTIGTAMQKQKLKMAGAPFAIYFTNSQTQWEMDAAVSVDKPGKDDGIVKSGKLAAGNAIVVHYFGNYNKVGVAHKAAHDYIQAHQKTINGAPWEVYVTDPGMEKDTAKWQTDVFYPIK